MNTWNKISEYGNPEDTNDYLILTNEEYIYVASWHKIWETKNYWKWIIRCECCYAEDCLLNQNMVTHWMPLPELPMD